MATTAAFYVGKGKHSTFVRSLVQEGYPSSSDNGDRGVPRRVLTADSEEEFRSAVQAYARTVNSSCMYANQTKLDWKASKDFDYVYCFFDGAVWVSAKGGWFNPYAKVAPPPTAPPAPLTRKGRIFFEGYANVICGKCHFGISVTLLSLRRMFGIEAGFMDAIRYFKKEGFRMTPGFGWQCPRCLKKKRK